MLNLNKGKTLSTVYVGEEQELERKTEKVGEVVHIGSPSWHVGQKVNKRGTNWSQAADTDEANCLEMDKKKPDWTQVEINLQSFEDA